MVVGSAFIALIGPGGLTDRIAGVTLARTLAGVVLAHAFYNTSIVVRMVGSAWANLDPRLAESARMLGAGKAASFLRVTARLLLPSVAASALQQQATGLIRRELERCGGSVSEAARRLGISRTTIYRHLRTTPTSGR